LTGNLPASERLEGTLAAIVIARMNGASYVRVHDVKEARRALQVADAIANA
jgi:dihydropteroate synthase